MNQNDEGLDVNLLPDGMSIRDTGRAIDKTRFYKWVESIKPDMPRLIQEHGVAEMIGKGLDALTERYIQYQEDSLINGYTIIQASVLTRLTLGGILFDSLVEISPKVGNMINLLGYAPILTLFKNEDYELYNPSTGQPFLGRIKVITLDEIFYQG